MVALGLSGCSVFGSCLVEFESWVWEGLGDRLEGGEGSVTTGVGFSGAFEMEGSLDPQIKEVTGANHLENTVEAEESGLG